MGEWPEADLDIEIIRSYAKHSKYRVFVETGTAVGYTTGALLDDFERIYTIELGEAAHAEARRKFAPFPKVTALRGDSAKVLPYVLGLLATPAVFWLDAHYSGDGTARGSVDTPIAEELRLVFESGLPHVVLVDDMRLFGVDPAYPSMEWVAGFVAAQEGRFDMKIETDMARIVPVGMGHP
jgi:hypothetical protein